jgi:hypothetical protein
MSYREIRHATYLRSITLLLRHILPLFRGLLMYNIYAEQMEWKEKVPNISQIVSLALLLH